MPREKLLTRAFFLGFAANFLHSLAFHTYLHLPGFLHEQHADESTIGVIMGIFSLSAIASRPIVGRLIDRRGRRLVLLAGSAVHVVCTLLYLSVTGIGPWIYVVRIFHGIAEGMLFSVIFTIAADIVPASRRAEGIGLYGLSGMIPLGLGGLIGDGILADGTYHDLFVFTAITAGLAAGMSWFLPDSRPPDDGSDGDRSFIAAIWTSALRPVWLVTLSFTFALSSVFTFLKTFVIEHEIGSVGSFFSAYTIAAVLLRLAFGWVPDRFGQERVLIPALVCTALGTASLALAQSDLHVMLAGVLCGVGHGYVFPIASSLAVTRSAAAGRGTVLAAFTALFDLGLLIGAPTLGFIVDHTGYGSMYVTAGTIAALGTVVFWAWDRRRQGA